MNTLTKAWQQLGVAVGLASTKEKIKAIKVEGIELCSTHDGVLIEGDPLCFWSSVPNDYGECVGTPLYRKVTR